MKSTKFRKYFSKNLLKKIEVLLLKSDMCNQYFVPLYITHISEQSLFTRFFF